MHLCKELFVYCKPNTSNSLHACTQLIQLLVLLPIYTFDRGTKSRWVNKYSTPHKCKTNSLRDSPRFGMENWKRTMTSLTLFCHFCNMLNLEIGFYLSRRIKLTAKLRNINITLLEAAVYLIRMWWSHHLLGWLYISLICLFHVH